MTNQSPDASAAARKAGPRVELILQQLDALPTLNAIAVRVIELTTANDFRADQVIKLIAADPSLSTRVLRMCRCSGRVRSNAITSIDRAVLHVGFDAVRSAVLSVEIFDFFETLKNASGETRGDECVFDREAFWHHSLAVAVLAEQLIGQTNLKQTFTSGEAFLTGLLHDLGLLALHVLLPQSTDRICRLAETSGISIDAACSRLIGTTTQTTGKRLAERWQLPRSIGDVAWLHGQPVHSLPNLPHRGLIALVSLADILARARYVAPTGHLSRGETLSDLCIALDLDPTVVEQAASTLHQEVSDRAAILGMNDRPDMDLVLRCVSRANQSLGRANEQMRRASTLATQHTRTLQAITKFHDNQSPGDTTVSVVEKVAQSAIDYLGEGFFAMLLPEEQSFVAAESFTNSMQLMQFTRDGFVLRSEMLTPPQGSVTLADLADGSPLSMQLLSLLPWLSDYLVDACDLRSVKLLPLRCGWGVCGVLLHDRTVGSDAQHQFDALTCTWAAAIAAGAQHQGARALGEQLADANRMIVEAQEELANRKALASLGEIVAGAAHEMNNPLTIISGRSQQLVSRLIDCNLRASAELIQQQSHRVSDLISALREFTEPAHPKRRPVDLSELVVNTVRHLELPENHELDINTIVSDTLPHALIDPRQISEALNELLRNAVESKGCRHIELRVQITGSDDRLKIQVRDDGAGLNAHTLTHAFEPFFSSKPAGRQPGLGLARARRFVDAHEGRLTLENGPGRGAVATIWLDQWRCEGVNSRAVA